MSIDNTLSDVTKKIDDLDGLVVSNPLFDGTVGNINDGRRRTIKCARFKGDDNLRLCVAAWHGVLHWLRYNDEPVFTGIISSDAKSYWPFVSEVKPETALSDLLSIVESQWPEDGMSWPRLADNEKQWMQDQLHCHVIRLTDADIKSDERAEFELIHCNPGWKVDCAASCYSEKYQQRLMALWSQIVQAMRKDASSLLSQLLYKDESGKADFDGYSIKGPTVPIIGNLIQRFYKQVEDIPQKIAVKDQLNELTYKELDSLTNAWAHALSKTGVLAGQCVGVAFGRNIYMVAAQIAVLKLGAVFVPLDSEQPETRLTLMIEDADITTIFTEKACSQALATSFPELNLLLIESIPKNHRALKKHSVDHIKVDDLAYIIFTSGSTGRPKGVKVSHGNLLNFVMYIERYPGCKEVVSQFAPFTFDASVAEIHGAILNGATLVILSGQLIDNPEKLQSYMTEQEVTFCAFPPQYAKYLSPKKLPTVKTLLTAGSAPDLELVQRWQPHVNYVNAYGPTETTVLSTAWDANDLPAEGEPIVMGSPIDNTGVRIINRFGQSLPDGLMGELLIGGAGVSRGYLKRDDLNSTVFITTGKDNWYKSGDLSCLNHKKQLIFSGRVDSQFKLRGHRLEPGEVETALRSIKGVEQAAAVFTNTQSVTQLVVFCKGKQIPETEMREKLAAVLPRWAMPNRIFWLSAMPFTVNGKIDYEKLRTQLSQFDDGEKSADHHDELEAQVAEIWQNVLQLPVVSREDNFIHLGGDSLTSLVVMSALKSIGYSISSAQLLSHPRLADFVQLLRYTQKQERQDYSTVVGEATISPMQGWFFNLPLTLPGKVCQSLVFDVDDALDINRLQRAISRLVSYHDGLRASFFKVVADTPMNALEQREQYWRQRIEYESLTLPQLKVVEVDDTELQEASDNYRELLAAELNIEQAPLFKIVVLHTPSRFRIVWVFHHLIIDTISHGILLDDLYNLYHSDLDAKEVLPGKSISYMDWSDKLLNHVEANVDECLQQWKPVLEAVTLMNKLPLNMENENRGEMAIEYCRLPNNETTRLIEEATQCYHQGAEELALASVYLALSESLGLENVGVDIEWHGRDEEFAGIQGVDRTVGWFTSVHPLIMQVPARVDLADWLVELKEARASIVDRGRDFYTLRYLSRNTAVRHAFSQYHGPEVLFNFSGIVQRSRKGWCTVPVVAIEWDKNNPNPYALSVESEIRDGALSIGLYYDPVLWPKNVINGLKNALKHQLRRVIEHCTNPENHRWTPSDFPMLELTQGQVDELPRKIKAAYPLTDMQQTMVRHADIYQVYMHYRIPRAFDPTSFQAAAEVWVSRHDCLRTFIKEWDGNHTVQVVLDKLTPSVNIHQVKPGTTEEYVAEWIQDSRGKQISLAKAPLFSLQVIVEGGDVFSVILSIHHIIHDGWSIELLIKDLFQCYCFQLNELEQISNGPLASMADIVAEQRRLANDGRWRDYWAGLPWAPTSCQLPNKTTTQCETIDDPDVELFVGELSPEIVQLVRDKAKQMGVTVNSMWLTAYACLLRYLGGQEQVRCGVIQSGRMESIPGVETITGCCVNTLPLVVNITASDSPLKILESVNERLTKMREAVAFPLSDIHSMVKQRIEGEMFDSLFNIESIGYSEQEHGQRPTLLGGYESTNYKFIFGLIEGDVQAESRFGIRIGYDVNAYDAESIARWLEIYEHCLSLLVKQGDFPWNQLQMLPENMVEQVKQWNQTARDYPNDQCVSGLFSEQVARVPERSALRYKDKQISYSQLDAYTDQLAVQLQAKGVGPEVVVGLVAERSAEMVIAILAVFKAGGAYVPIDPKYPADRVRHMVEDVGSTLVIFQAERLSNVVPEDVGVQRLFLDAMAWNHESVERPNANGHHSRQLAYVMYTSGSTGQPKGVMIEHRSIARLVKNSNDIRFSDDDCILLTSAPGFDVTTFEVWSALCNGLTLAIIDEETLLDPEQLAREIKDKGVTMLWLVSPLFNQLVQAKPNMFNSVKMLMIGGDALSPYHIRMVKQANPDLQVVNGYGPTENTSFSTYHFIDQNDVVKSIPIGRPINNSTAYIFNQDRQLLPPGVNGELYVGGDGVARGYLNRPELSAEKFVQNPLSDDPQDTLYKTGDLVRWRKDGLIDFLGRIDHQIKIRGFRVELGEIENNISACDGVKQVLVMTKEEGGQKILVCYMVVEQAKVTNEADKKTFIDGVRKHLAARLPDYMVPTAFVVLDTMPLNANGKIDREKLPEVDDSAYVQKDCVEPQSEREKLLWDIWKDVLRISDFGVTDSFYSIGGDSILSIQLVSRAARQGIKLSTRNIFEHRTIRQLAKHLDDNETDFQVREKSNVATVDGVKGEQRLLPIQLKFFHGDSEDRSHYNQHVLLDLPRDSVSLGILKEIFLAIAKRHDVLRLKFRKTPTGWNARYNSDAVAEFADSFGEFITEIDVSSVDPNRVEKYVNEAADQAQSGLDIGKGRLCRWVLFKGKERDRLLWVMHHLVVDGISWRVLVHDFETAFQMSQQGRSPELGPKTSSFQNWAAEIYEYAYSAQLEREKSFWLSQLSQPSASLPLDRPNATDNKESNTSEIQIELDHIKTEQLLRKANLCYDTNINDLLLAALSITLTDWVSDNSIRVDLEGHGREPLFDGMDLSETVGWFTTIYPVNLTKIDGDVGRQIQWTKEQRLRVPHNGIGYGVLCYVSQDEDLLELSNKQGGGESQVIFNYLGQLDQSTSRQQDDIKFSRETCGKDISPHRQRLYVLGINGSIINGCLQFSFDYNVKQFDGRTIVGVAEKYAKTLEEIIEHCTADRDGQNASDFPLASLSQNELDLLQSRFNNIADIYPCTGMQQGLVLYTEREPDSGVYLTQIRITLDSVDPQCLRQSWQILVDRHDILRTAFVDIEHDQLLQVVSAGVEVPWREVDWRKQGKGDASEKLEALLTEDRIKPFDCAKAPLMRFLLVRVDDRHYQLAWTHHHALLDGWSMSILLKELFAVYEALQTNEQVSLANNEPYKHYIQWLQKRDYVGAQEYWKKYLHGIDSPTALAVQMRNKGEEETALVDDRQQRQYTLEVDRESTEQLEQVAKSVGVTLSTIMQAAWGLLLSKYSGENEVVFGYTVSGRPADLRGVESMVGLFINSLPMRVIVSPDMELGNWLKQIQLNQMDSDEFNFVPLADIQKWSGFPPHRQLFETLLVVENYPIDKSALSAAHDQAPNIIDIEGVERNDFGLNLVIYPGDRLKLKLAYRSKDFDDSVAQSMLVHLRQLLVGISQGSAQTISQIPMLTENETLRAIRNWNETKMSYPHDQTLPALFAKQAEKRGQAPALVMDGQSWSYTQLESRASNIAAWLSEKGIGAGDYVALSYQKEPDLIAAILGILQVGAAYVPIAIDCPIQRREFIVADAGIKWVITKREFAEKVGAGAQPLCLDDLSGVDQLSPAAFTNAANSQSAAYVIYTSGTTGKPKGVVVSHQNVINFCYWCILQQWAKEGDAITQFAPYTFDASAGEIFYSLLSGTKLHLLNDTLIQDPDALTQYMVDNHVRFGAFPPPYLQQMNPEKLHKDITILSAGSAPTADLVQRWGSHCQYINAYGPTETTILSSAWLYNEADLKDGKIPIGKPIGNTAIYVLDRTGQLCAPGLTGEICVSGDGVTKGYLNRPSLTQQNFIQDPWVLNSRMYRTGDLGRWLEDGSIEFMGRRDHQVKIRGFRIELSGIEAQLARNPDIQEATVQVRGEGRDKQLYAWIVPQDTVLRENPNIFEQATDFIKAARSSLKISLPDYMIPQVFTLLPKLPLTANGKVDVDALPDPDVLGQVEEGYVAPTSELQHSLVGIWSAVLKLKPEQISVKANFFDIGGHSLLATRLVNEMAKQLQIRIPIRSIFEQGTVEALAELIEHSERCDLATIKPVDRSQPLPLSYSQQRLWFVDQLDGSSVQYNQPLVLRMEGDLDTDALQKALDALVLRHEVLRTTYAAEGGDVRQIINTPRSVKIGHVDLSKIQGKAQNAEVDRLAQIEAGTAFNLSLDLMLRIKLLKLDKNEHIMLLTMHHIASDGWSLSILIKEMCSFYEAFHLNKSPEPAALPIQYVDYAYWQRQPEQLEALEQQLRYWKGLLTGLPPVHSLPLDKPRPAQQSYQGDSFTWDLDKKLTNNLRTLAKQHQATLFMVVNSAFSALLSRYSGQTDIVLGSTISNRGQAEVEPLIGFFVNTLMLRSDLSDDPKFIELLNQSRERTLGAYANQQLPFDMLVDKLQPERSLSYHPLFQIMLSMENSGDTSIRKVELQDLVLSFVEDINQVSAQFDLMLDVHERDDSLQLHWTFVTDLFEKSTIERMAQNFECLLHSIVCNPRQHVSQLSLLSDAEQKLLLAEFNKTSQPQLLELTWPEMFAAQVSKTPDKIAVQCEECQLSYQELDAKSSYMAQALRDYGIQNGQIVALLDERGIDLLVMIMAVLKAGAAYLPLDPTHPSKRWLEILGEGKPNMLVVGDGLATEYRWLQRKWEKSKVFSIGEINKREFAEIQIDYPCPSDLAYVIYTSGSTGKPKGVMIEHRGMINNMRAKIEPLSLTPDDVIAQTASQCFDISVWQFLTAPILGAKVCIIPSEVTRDAEALLQRIEKYNVTIWEPVPSVINSILPYHKTLQRLRWIIPTGEALTKGLVERWFKEYPHIPMMNAYGPAECSDDVSFQPIYEPVKKVLIGKPVANAYLHVVDENLSLVPIGVVGELAVSGPVVGRGYLNQPEQTQAVFKNNPYSKDQTDKTLYLTGDLARRLGDGSLEYVGRKDFQVKVRGFRIELNEIESYLEQYPSVKEAVVTVHENDRGDKQLVAYVSRKASNDAINAETLRKHLKAGLPDYMVPNAYVVLDKMPLTSNGKVDRKALPAPDQKAFQSEEYVAPMGKLEETMAKIWQDILNIPKVGRNDNFFHLGGNSLLIIQMVNLLRKSNILLSVNDVYQAGTLKGCCDMVSTEEVELPLWMEQHEIRFRNHTIVNKRDTHKVLLINKQDKAKCDGLSKVLSTQKNDTIPDFIRFFDDLEQLTSTEILDRNMKSEKNIIGTFIEELQKFEAGLLSSIQIEEFPFTAMQKELLQWKDRNNFNWVTINGWYSETELKTAFDRLVAEQDLLRSIPDEENAIWKLLNADATKGLVPVVKLPPFLGKNRSKLKSRLVEKLGAFQSQSPLSYMAAWISESDTKHHFVMVNDHLICDGASSAVLKRRLSAFLGGRIEPVNRTYREYVAETYKKTDGKIYDTVVKKLDLEDVENVISSTTDVLQSRQNLPLRRVLLKAPLLKEQAVVDQAFNWFKEFIMRLTEMKKFGMVLNHFGRTANDFDQFGLFLDKVPFSVNESTLLSGMSNVLQYLQEEGVNFIGLQKANKANGYSVLPDLSREILFNFNGELSDTIPQQELLDKKDFSAKLKKFYGVLFEAYSNNGELVVDCTFRGKKSDNTLLLNSMIGSSMFNYKQESLQHITETSNKNIYIGNNILHSIEVVDVKKRYKDFEAVKGVSFSVPKGTCFGILGPNGAGKTSLLGMIEGITPITSGSIKVLGMDVRTEINKIQPHMGVQLQQNNYFQFLTVEELLKFYKELRSANKRKANGSSIDTLLQQLNLLDKKKFKVDELSGGQKQRLSIAIALLEDPDILFLDEPTSALDPHSRHCTWEFIEQLKKDKSKTIVLTTHYMEEAERLCDELMIMNDGKIISQGSPKELVNSLNTHHDINLLLAGRTIDYKALENISGVTAFDWDENTGALTVKTSQYTESIKELLNYCEKNNIEILHFDINRPKLEDVFLTSTGKEKVA